MFFFFSIATKRKKNGVDVTFWTALVASSAEPHQRSAAECEGQSVLLATRRDQTLPLGEEPEILDALSQLMDDRYTGHFSGLGHAMLPRG